ncbi:DUF6894 family protein [Jiella avicenniae]|uniref:DUF6894 domain-containing protein n=1 Tax=Jiella avicenniae TaxID=2907202 RepID=A0A9X1P5H3_9HYPH|nr:hypothetical protein [Jiella avicenniae]MCE7029658.1 hypothetical protein [Jiella avicenniae]
MPHHYFDVTDEDRFFRDETGLPCPDEAAVRDAAIRALPTMARDVMPDGDAHQIAVRVRDGDGRYVSEASLTLTAGSLDPESES